MKAIEEFQETAAQIGERVGPAVVAIGRRHRRGAGVIVGEGLVLTNAHNLHGERTTVVFSDGHKAPAAVRGADVDGDLAVLAADTGDARPVDWSEDPVRAGTVVFALGPTADGSVRTTAGMITATGRAFRGPRGRLIRDGLEHTAPLARGSSGGPVVEMTGRLAGISTHRLGDGFYMALPATADLKARVDALAAGQTPARRYLGVSLAPSDTARRLRRSVGLPDREGLLVRGVDPDSPAERAGIKEGDLIVAAAGRDVMRIDDLHSALDTLAPDDSLEVRVIRGIDELDVSVTFGPAREEGSA